MECVQRVSNHLACPVGTWQIEGDIQIICQLDSNQSSGEKGKSETENEATRRLISQFMARSACQGWSRGGWGRLRRGSMNGLVSGREEFGASLAQHMTIKCCTAAAVAVAAANCGKKCRRRPKAAPWQSGGKGHRNYFIRATPQHSPPPSLPPSVQSPPQWGSACACARRMST